MHQSSRCARCGCAAETANRCSACWWRKTGPERDAENRHGAQDHERSVPRRTGPGECRLGAHGLSNRAIASPAARPTRMFPGHFVGQPVPIQIRWASPAFGGRIPAVCWLASAAPGLPTAFGACEQRAAKCASAPSIPRSPPANSAICAGSGCFITASSCPGDGAARAPYSASF